MSLKVASTPASPKLCQTCRNIFEGPFRLSIPFPPKYQRKYPGGLNVDDPTPISPSPHQRSWQELQYSASQNCFICVELVERLSQRQLAGKTPNVITSYFLWHDQFDDRREDTAQHIFKFKRLSFTFESGSEVKGESIVLSYVLFKTSELESYRGGDTFFDNTGSPATWKIAQGWFEGCLINHENCRRGVGVEHARRLPSRLLALSDEKSLKMRLQDTEDLPVSTQYTTLSHRWGSAKVVILTSASELSLREGINISDLSKTFQDSIIVSRKLDIHYLWIDSMCIFQDSRSDWERESAMMGEVYRNSACNIGATGSTNSDGGLFHDRNPADILPYSIDCDWSPDPATEEKDKKDLGLRDNYTLFPKEFWNQELSTAPLLSRGWVVQERILCPRMLHFGTRQILWECLELDASEVYPRGRPDQDLAKNNLSQWSIFKPIKPQVDSNTIDKTTGVETISRDNFAVWKKVVTLSCMTNLTKSSDKLVSLSGVAKSMLVPPGDQYLAGIWKSFIFAFLFWRVPDGKQANGERSKRISPYVAPTWSWASLDAVIDYGVYSLYAIFPKILETHVELATPDPTGQVLSAFIRLKGPLFSLKIQDPVKVSSDVDGVVLSTLRDFDVSLLWGYYDQEEGQPISLNDDPMKASLKPDVVFNHDTEDLFFLATEFGWSFRMEGMILTRSGKSDGSYIRIGYLAINMDDSRKRWGIEYEDAWPKLEPLLKEIKLI